MERARLQECLKTCTPLQQTKRTMGDDFVTVQGMSLNEDDQEDTRITKDDSLEADSSSDRKERFRRCCHREKAHPQDVYSS